MTTLFPPELRTASIVPRWSIVHTLCRDTLSNHSFFVAYYALQIARLVGWYRDYHAPLMEYALVHDMDEIITGDIVSPVKHAVVDPERLNTLVQPILQDRMPTVTAAMIMADVPEPLRPEIKALVKAADRLDALLFLITEMRLGNTIIKPRVEDALRLFREAWMRLPGREERLTKVLDDEMMPAIHAHYDVGGFGV